MAAVGAVFFSARAESLRQCYRMNPYDPGCPLKTVDITAEVSDRTGRKSNSGREAEIFASIAIGLDQAPQRVLEQLTDSALELCRADSAGISLEELEAEPAVFRWRTVRGKMAPFIGGTMPRWFSPCGDVLAQQRPIAMRQLTRRYRYAETLGVGFEETLLVPFTVHRRMIGTLWMISHAQPDRFDRDDLRVTALLAGFVGKALESSQRARELAAIASRLESLSSRVEGELSRASRPPQPPPSPN